jgi:hypothetical protein
MDEGWCSLRTDQARGSLELNGLSADPFAEASPLVVVQPCGVGPGQ